MFVSTADMTARFGSPDQSSGWGKVVGGVAVGGVVSIGAAALLSSGSAARLSGNIPLLALFLRPSPEAALVIAAIIGIAFYTLAQILMHSTELAREREALERCRGAVRGQLPQDIPVNLRQAILTSGQNTLTVRAVQAVWDAHELQTPDMEAISGSLATLEESVSSVGANVGNRLMLLSLLGTIIGLAGVVSTLQPQLGSFGTSGDVQSLLNSLQATLTSTLR